MSSSLSSVLLFLIVCTSAEIISYNNLIESGKPYFVEIPKFAPADVPHWSPGKGHNTIDASRLSIRNVCQDRDNCFGALEFMIFLAPIETGKPWVEAWDDSEMCCTSEMADEGLCGAMEVNTLITPPSIKDSFKQTISLEGKAQTSLDNDAELDVSVKRKGIYVVMFAVCDPKSAPVQIEGYIESMNPYGYTPADSFADIPFYGTLSGLYLVFGIGWLICCTLHSEELISLQYWITGALALGMIETTLLFTHFLVWNEHGVVEAGLLGTGLIVGVTKRAVSRVVVLLVSMGWGVVRQSIGEDMKRVLYLGAAYAVLSSIYTMAASMPKSAKYVGDPEFENMFSLVVMLLATVDTTFYMWTISSLNNLIITLRARKQTAKLDLYCKFRYVLFASVTLAVFWATYGAWLVAGDVAERNWDQRWSIDACSEVIYWTIFVAIAILWAPYRNNQRYVSYVELSQVTSEDGEDGSGKNYSSEDELDDEYGGPIEEDPFQGTGALDPAMAVMKKINIVVTSGRAHFMVNVGVDSM